MRRRARACANCWAKALVLWSAGKLRALKSQERR